MTEEQLYSQDLAIRHYSGKWKAAKNSVADRMQLPHRKLTFPLPIDYWLAVRLHYLETGGLYIEQLALTDQLQYV